MSPAYTFLFLIQNEKILANLAVWFQVFADDRAAYNGFGKKVKSFGQISEESLGLEPLGSEVLRL